MLDAVIICRSVHYLLFIEANFYKCLTLNKIGLKSKCNSISTYLVLSLFYFRISTK